MLPSPQVTVSFIVHRSFLSNPSMADRIIVYPIKHARTHAEPLNVPSCIDSTHLQRAMATYNYSMKVPSTRTHPIDVADYKSNYH